MPAFHHLRASLLGLVLLATLTLAPLCSGMAQELPTPRIMVVDLNYVMANSSAMQGIQNQVDAEESALEQQMQERENQLRQQDEALQQERGQLSAEDFEERRRALEAEFAQYQREFAQRLEEMDESYAEAVGEVEVTLLRIADELASEYGANVVMPKSTLLLVHEDFEKTEEVLKRPNERLPRVEVTP